MSETELSFEGALREGWRLTKSRVGLWIGFLPLLLGLAIVEALLTRLMDAASVRLALGLVFKFAQWFLTFNALGVSLKLVDGQEASFADLFAGRPGFWWYVLGTLLYGLVCGIGLILLIVPGAILGLMFMFYGYVIVERNVNPIDAFRESARLTAGLKGQLFLFTLLLLGVNILGLLALGVGLFVSMAISYFAIAHLYREITRRAGAASAG